MAMERYVLVFLALLAVTAVSANENGNGFVQLEVTFDYMGTNPDPAATCVRPNGGPAIVGASFFLHNFYPFEVTGFLSHGVAGAGGSGGGWFSPDDSLSEAITLGPGEEGFFFGSWANDLEGNGGFPDNVSGALGMFSVTGSGPADFQAGWFGFAANGESSNNVDYRIGVCPRTPELSTWALLACSGLAGLVLRRRRKT